MRSDVLLATDSDVIQQFKQRAKQLELDAAERVIRGRDPQDRQATRRTLVESKYADPKGLERILGRSDLCSVNFLRRGIQAGRAVARLRVRLANGSGEWFGTGFLAAPGLLATNHHVIGSADEAALTAAEFDFEHDIHGVIQSERVFNLMPSRCFFTDAALDVTFVAIAPRAFDGTPLSSFGHLPLIPESGKGLDGEWVSLIQHPGGLPKQIAIRDSQIVVLDQNQTPHTDLDRFIHYTADTEPGASGAPVFNDQWQVVAIHHRAVPDKDEEGRRLTRDGETIWEEGMGEEEKGWVANEGVRISAIANLLQTDRWSDPAANQVIRRLAIGLQLNPQLILPELSREAAEEAQEEEEAQGRPSPPKVFEGAEGYDPDFLSQQVPLPEVDDDDVPDIAVLIDTDDEIELKYRHFSVVFNAARRCAHFTAVNIDGGSLVQNKGLRKTWRRDARIQLEIQPDDAFYKKSIAPEEVFFQRGHLVRRVAPSWGDEDTSELAVKDTFHFTNAAPHEARFNNSIWGDLEDYLLDKCDRDLKRMVVFSGPIFRDSDPENYGLERPLGPYQIPLQFWKVAVIQKTPQQLAAAAFIVGQKEQLRPLEDEERVFTGLNPYTVAELHENQIQTTVEVVESETGLDFGNLRDLDTQAGLESTRRNRFLRSVRDIII